MFGGYLFADGKRRDYQHHRRHYKIFAAAADSGITFVCIQMKENSLGGFTADDAVVY